MLGLAQDEDEAEQIAADLRGERRERGTRYAPVKTRIAIGSKMMLSESPEASSIVGVLLSPSARMRFVCVWKKTKSVMPA